MTSSSLKINTRYDLPIKHDALSHFQSHLTAVLTLLALAILTAFFLMQDLGQRWTSDISGKTVVELQIVDKGGALLSNEVLDQKIEAVSKALSKSKFVVAFNVIAPSEIKELLEDWLGDNFENMAIGYPRLISVELKDRKSYGAFKKALEKAFQDVSVSMHEDWLGDLLRILSTAEFWALLALAAVLTIIFLIIAVAVGARMQVLREEIEVLHLIGAPDAYIACQFQRQSFWLSLKGVFLGCLAAGILSFVLFHYAFSADRSFITIQFMDSARLSAYLGVMVLIVAVSSIVAGLTAYASLRKMP